MKLINKKTGEIAEIILKLNESLPDGIRRTIEEAGWEETREPLIKDEKIRKFVRAWAEVNGFNVLKYLEGSRTCELSYRLKNSDGDVVMELLGGIDGLENCKEYSITELCGEEEE